MRKDPSVSVIIPTYNRQYLLGETLDSILMQSFNKWECIVVDDGSVDYTDELLDFYCEKDSRIKYYHRPKNRLKGANSCRNYGFEKCIGDYIIWFDSDDIMHPYHIEKKVKALSGNSFDFVVAKTQNFNDNGFQAPYKYVKKEYGIRASDFILLKIHWYTYDILLRRKIGQKIKWNEKMKSWQDYNYFCKMVLITEKGKYLDAVLTHRRLHSDSIQKSLNRNSVNFKKELLENRILTFNDIGQKVDFNTKNELIYGIMNLCFQLIKVRRFSSYFLLVTRIIYKTFGLKSVVYFILSLITAFISGRGNFFLEMSKQK